MKTIKLNFILLSAAIILFLSSCGRTIVLLADFRSDAIGSQPMLAQQTGTVSIEPGAGSIVIVNPPSNAVGEKWVQINHPNAPSEQTALRCDFSRFDGRGEYGMLATVYIPSNTGVATLQFEPFGIPSQPYLNFLHFDFMPEGNIRINDGTTRFGQFPKDKSFVVSLSLNITSSNATVQIDLLGDGASGSHTVTVSPSLLFVAQRFGAVRFWMGYQHAGSFYVDNILVTRKN